MKALITKWSNYRKSSDSSAPELAVGKSDSSVDISRVVLLKTNTPFPYTMHHPSRTSLLMRKKLLTVIVNGKF